MLFYVKSQNGYYCILNLLYYKLYYKVLYKLLLYYKVVL